MREKTDKMIFWGAGNTTNIWWEDIQKAGLKPAYIVDSCKRGTCHNIPIIHPDELYQIADIGQYDLIIMSVSFQTQQVIRKQIESLQIVFRNIFSCSEAYYKIRRKECENIIDLLHDEKSKKTMKAWLRSMVEGQNYLEDLIDFHGYFALSAFRGCHSDEVFVDCGAYVGDTLEKYMFERFGMFQKYYAFEPFPENYEALLYRVKRLEKEWNAAGKIICENRALGCEAKVASISDEVSKVGAMIKDADSAGTEISVISMDQYFGEETRISCIKADIEGSEIEMLKGAEHIIRTQKPKLAISLYHKPGDVIDIIQLVHSYNRDYILDVRCSYSDGTDFVLFAY